MDVFTLLLIAVAVLAVPPLGLGIAALAALAVFGPSPGEVPLAYLIGGAVLLGSGLAVLGIGLSRNRRPARVELAGE